MLRKGFEKTLKAYLTPRERLDRNCEELSLAGMVERALLKATAKAKTS